MVIWKHRLKGRVVALCTRNSYACDDVLLPMAQPRAKAAPHPRLRRGIVHLHDSIHKLVENFVRLAVRGGTSAFKLASRNTNFSNATDR
jgi:hypothetical protein